MDPQFEWQRAKSRDIPTLLHLMRQFYTHEKIAYDAHHCALAVEALMEDRTLGLIAVSRSGDLVAGYMVLTYCFSVEFGGRFLLVDELFIAPEFQGNGAGKAALQYAENHCRRQGISTLRLEVQPANLRAQQLYQQRGFQDDQRLLYSKQVNLDPGRITG